MGIGVGWNIERYKSDWSRISGFRGGSQAAGEDGEDGVFEEVHDDEVLWAWV
jgi:hypothetical protein